MIFQGKTLAPAFKLVSPHCFVYFSLLELIPIYLHICGYLDTCFTRVTFVHHVLWSEFCNAEVPCFWKFLPFLFSHAPSILLCSFRFLLRAARFLTVGQIFSPVPPPAKGKLVRSSQTDGQREHERRMDVTCKFRIGNGITCERGAFDLPLMRKTKRTSYFAIC